MDGERPEWLPKDWKVCERVWSSSKKDKYYVNPSNDLKFNSKPEMLRYLKSCMKDLKGRKLSKKDGIEESRRTRKGGKTRGDPIMPWLPRALTLLRFSLWQEVKRHLETKNVGKEECTMDESEKSGSAEAENINTPNTDASEGIDKEKDSTVEDEEQEKAAVRKKRKKNNKWMNGLPRRASKRLARVEAEPLFEVKTSTRAREATRLQDEAEGNTNQSKSGKTDVTTTSAEEQGSASVDLKEDEKSGKQPDNDSSLIDLFMDPCIEFAIKTLTGAIPLEEVSQTHEASPIKASSSSSVLPFGDIWADPCFEFSVKVLTSEINMEDDSHSQTSFSLGCNNIAK